jgi:hypothetical protein
MTPRIGITVLTLSCLLASLAGIAGPARAAEPKQEHPQGAAMDAGAEAMMKAATPGEPQKHLGQMAGDWTFEQKFWMAPGQPPAESKGTMHAELLMGGRYVEHHWHGNFMGMPFEGRGTDGYDNVSKQYVNTWIDNMGTGIMNGTGTCDDAGKKCTYTNSMNDPMTGKPATMRTVITWVDNDTFTNEMWSNDPSGKEMKMMEITAKRKK